MYFGEDVYSVSPWMDNGTSITYVQNHTTVDRLQLLSEVTAGILFSFQLAVSALTMN